PPVPEPPSPVLPAPPAPVVLPQSAGKSASVLPGQSSQRPQVLPQVSVLTQRGHAFSSATSSVEHVELSMMSTVVSPVCTVQQPKQSQRLGVSGAQNLMQAAVSLQSLSVGGRSPVRQPVL